MITNTTVVPWNGVEIVNHNTALVSIPMSQPFSINEWIAASISTSSPPLIQQVITTTNDEVLANLRAEIARLNALLAAQEPQPQPQPVSAPKPAGGKPSIPLRALTNSKQKIGLLTLY